MRGIRCKECGKLIDDKARYTLAMLSDPVFCNKDCCAIWIVKNRQAVLKYVLDFMVIKEE